MQIIHSLNSKQLEELDHPLELCAWMRKGKEYGDPVAVIVPYQLWLDIQFKIIRASEMEELDGISNC